MIRKALPSPLERRSFLTRLSAGVTAFAVTFTAGSGGTRAQSRPIARWQPERHEKDDWLDQLPGKHRMVFDTTKPDGFGEAIVFASNFIRVNQTDYAVPSNELAIIIVARSRSTPFAYNDAMWEKYGVPLAQGRTSQIPRRSTLLNSTFTNRRSMGTNCRHAAPPWTHF